MKVALHPLLVKREKLEAWLNTKALQGWILHDFAFIAFQSCLSCRFEEMEPKEVTYALYECTQDYERTIWLDEGWQLIYEKDRLLIFMHDGKGIDFPLLKMSQYIYRRCLKSLLNIFFLMVLLLEMRMPQGEIRSISIFFACFLLLVIPNWIGVTHGKEEAKFIRIIKNIITGILIGGFLTIIIELFLRALSVYM